MVFKSVSATHSLVYNRRSSIYYFGHGVAKIAFAPIITVDVAAKGIAFSPESEKELQDRVPPHEATQADNESWL